MEVVVPIGQGGVDATIRGGDDAVDHNQLFHGDDCVDTLALDLANRHHLLPTLHGLHAVAHDHHTSHDERQGGQGTSTGRKVVVHGHLEVATRRGSDLRKSGALIVAAVRDIHHIGEDLFALGVDGQHTVTHLHIRQGLGGRREGVI